MCKRKCPLCNKEMTEHLLYKHFRNKCQFKNTMSMYEYTCLLDGKQFVDDLIQKYQSGVSLFEIERSTTRKTLSNIPSLVWKNIFSEQNIHIRNLKDTANSNTTRQKYKTTCEDKYGVSNVSQSEEIKQKKAETFTEHYGVDNIWKVPEFYEWMNDFMVKKYGKKRMSGWDYANKEERDRITTQRFQTLIANGHYDSMLEERVERILKENNIVHKRCFWAYHHPYDFIIGDHKYLFLEINGDYWHANPRIYKSTDVFAGGRTAQEIWDRDKKFRECLLNSKFNVVYLWEMDMKNMSDDEILTWVKQQISNKMDGLIDNSTDICYTMGVQCKENKGENKINTKDPQL